MPVNQAKLDKLKQQQDARIGGKGTARRKKKHVHKTATDDKRLQVRARTYCTTVQYDSITIRLFYRILFES